MFYVFMVLLLVAAVIIGVMGKIPPESFSELKRYTVAIVAFALGMVCVFVLTHFELHP